MEPAPLAKAARAKKPAAPARVAKRRKAAAAALAAELGSLKGERFGSENSGPSLRLRGLSSAGGLW